MQAALQTRDFRLFRFAQTGDVVLLDVFVLRRALPSQDEETFSTGDWGRLAAGVMVLALAAPLMLVREFARQMSFAHLELKRATALDVAAAGLQFVALFVLAACGYLTVTTTLATLAVASGIATVGWLATSRQGMLARASATVSDWVHNWGFSRWALASQLLASTTPYVMPWVIAATHGEAQTGLLGACMTLVGLSNTFLQGLCNFLSPRAAQAIVSAELFRENRTVILGYGGLIVEGVLQKRDGSVSVRAERFWPVPELAETASHDFR